MEEIWKDIPELKGRYQASNLGRIRSIDHYIKSNFHNCKQVKRKGKIIKEIKMEDLLKMKRSLTNEKRILYNERI